MTWELLLFYFFATIGALVVFGIILFVLLYIYIVTVPVLRGTCGLCQHIHPKGKHCVRCGESGMDCTGRIR